MSTPISTVQFQCFRTVLTFDSQYMAGAGAGAEIMVVVEAENK